MSIEICEMECDEPWFSHIKDGTKHVEGRKGSPKWAQLKQGDYIKIIKTGANDNFLVFVTGINVYEGHDCLTKYLVTETIARALPGITSIRRGIDIYKKWSTQAELDKYGFLGIQVKPL